jgi:predicted DNA-binding transcriptional regulator AlpA
MTTKEKLAAGVAFIDAEAAVVAAAEAAILSRAPSPRAGKPLAAKVRSPKELASQDTVPVLVKERAKSDTAPATKGKTKWADAREPPGLDYIIRKPQLSRFVGLNMSVIYDMMARDQFPRPIKPNPQGRVIGWLSSEIAEWQRERAKERDEAQGDDREPD